MALYGQGYAPRDVKKRDVLGFMESMRSEGLCVTTQRGYIVALKRLCQHCHNNVFDTMILTWSPDLRQNVEWLEKAQAAELLTAPMDARENIIVTLMLCMGLRRIEVIRLNVADIGDGWITVTGKGRLGGKLRTVPFHPRFESALKRWMEYRSKILGSETSDALIIYRHGKRISRYSAKGSAIDNIVRTVGNRVGFGVSCHTLRRTFGRLLWMSGVKVETIARILGHTSTVQTLRYIGVNLDDMVEGMNKLIF